MEVTQQTRFLRYLHYASEQGMYTPGCRFHFNNYSSHRIQSLYMLIESGLEKEVIDMITKVI